MHQKRLKQIMARKDYKQKESVLNKNVVDWLNGIKSCVAYKRAATMANRGKPDVSGCLAGVRIELEGKVGDNKPTALQRDWLKKWRAANAITGVYWSLEQAQQIVVEAAAERGIEI